VADNTEKSIILVVLHCQNIFLKHVTKVGNVKQSSNNSLLLKNILIQY